MWVMHPSDPWKSLKSVSFVVFGALGLRALWSLVKLALPFEVLRDMVHMIPVVDGLLMFLAVATTMMFLGLGASAARKVNGPVGFHPALAALSFVIPFANVILPALAMRQVWKAKNPHRNEGLVWGWWGLYIVHTIINAASIRIPIPYFGLLLVLALLGVWGAMIYFVGLAPAAAAAPGFAPQQFAPITYGQPAAYGQPAPGYYPQKNMPSGYPGAPAQPAGGYGAPAPQPGYPQANYPVAPPHGTPWGGNGQQG